MHVHSNNTAVKTKGQTVIPIHKCPYQFRFQNVKNNILLNKAKLKWANSRFRDTRNTTKLYESGA